MALSATFTANFSSFYDAVDKAEVKLKDFGAGADKVGGRLTAMANQFSGVKIVQEASLMVKAVEEIGGVSKLTEKELAKLGSTANEAVAKMKALGMDVPKNLQKIADETKHANQSSVDWMGTLTKVAGAIGIAFSIDAITGFMGSVFDAASAVKDLSQQWGFSTDAVQEWTGAARDSGITTEALGKSVMFVTEKLSESSEQYDALLANIGLSGEALRQMKMEDAYREILTAITAVKDETLQYDIALGILGPSAKQTIGGIRDGLVEATTAQQTMSEETIARLADAEDAWKRFKDNVVIYSGEMMATTMEHVNVMFSSWGNFFTMAGKGLKAQFTGGDDVAQYVKQMQGAATATAAVGEAMVPVASHGEDVNRTIKTTAQIAADLKKKEDGLKKAEQEREKALEKLKREEEAYSAALRKHDDALDDLTNTFSGRNVIGKANDYLAALKQSIPIEQMTATQKANINKVMEEAIGTYQALGEMAPKVMYDIWQATAKAGEGVVTFTERTYTLLEVIGDVNRHPIDLGQGVTMSLPPALTLMEQYEGSIRNVATAFTALGQQTGGGFGAVLSSLGGVVAGLDAGTLASKAFKTAMEEFKPGGDIALGMANTAAAAAAAAATFLQLTEGAGVLESTLTGAAMGFSLATPALGAFGLAAGAVVGYVRGLHTAAASQKEFFQMRGDFLMLASGATQTGDALQLLGEKIKGATGSYALMTQLMSADSQYELQRAATAIAEAFQFQAQALGHVTEAAERYGFTIEELGPAMQRQQLDEQAAQLYKDFQVLNQAGVEQVAIYGRMSDAVSIYVQDAVRMGVEIPSAMKPMLQGFADQGELLDEGGDKIRNLEDAGIEFSMTMTEGFKAMIEEVKKLTDAISRSLGLAITNIPQPTITGTVTWDVEDPQSRAQPHGDGGEHSYARGTGGFVNFGKGTPVILHGWEAVVPRDDANATVRSGGGALGAAPLPAIVINAQGAFFDTPDSLQRLANKVGDALTAKYSVMGKLRAAV